ncbi:MAG: DUF3107 domain-containing protein [Propionibacteriaceae bacterium]|jgi:hypothetical protein|nr:DUF3107 domain-containing protein [Propionibacteriaceae bacterium]
MEIKIGIKNVVREITVNVDQSIDHVVAKFAAARATDTLLTLHDTSGRQIMIPANAIGYVEFAQEHARPVGFGA